MTTVAGGDFRLRACFGPDRAQAEDSGDPSGMDACKGPSSEWPGSPVAVWRKYWLWPTEMAAPTSISQMPGPGINNQQIQWNRDPRNYTLVYNWISGAFDDGFVEFDYLTPETRTPFDYFLSCPPNPPAYGDSQTSFPHNDPPEPIVYTAQLIGMDRIDGPPTGSGTWGCVWSGDRRHAMVAVGAIFPFILFDDPRWGRAHPLEWYVSMTSTHEIGHAVGGFSGDTNHCPANPQDRSVMDYECQWRYGVNYFSLTEIARLRESPDPQTN